MGRADHPCAPDPFDGAAAGSQRDGCFRLRASGAAPELRVAARSSHAWSPCATRRIMTTM